MSEGDFDPPVDGEAPLTAPGGSPARCCEFGGAFKALSAGDPDAGSEFASAAAVAGSGTVSAIEPLSARLGAETAGRPPVVFTAVIGSEAPAPFPRTIRVTLWTARGSSSEASMM